MKLLIPHSFSYRKYYPGEAPLPHHATGAKLRDAILARTDQIEVHWAEDALSTQHALATAESIVAYSVQNSWLAQAPALRWIQAASAGIDHFFKSSDVDAQLLKARHIQLTKASGVSRIVIGEHVLAMLLALSRGVPRAVRQQMDRRWEIFAGRELYGKTLGIIGLGQIGERVAELAVALGMRVIGTTSHPGEAYSGAAHQTYHHDQIELIWPQADAVVLSCAVNEATRGLINRHTLERMRPGVLLLNVARGEIIVEQDLVEALKRGRVAGAALDTFGQPGVRGLLDDLEALHPDSELWQMENVLIMPNNAASTEQIFEYLADIIVENHRRLTHGLALKFKVEL